MIDMKKIEEAGEMFRSRLSKSTGNFEDTMYCRGYIEGSIEAMVEKGIDSESAHSVILRYLPDDFKLQAIPPKWFNLSNEPTNIIKGQKVNETLTFKHLKETLEIELSEEERVDMLNKYLYIIGTLERMYDKADNVGVQWTRFLKQGTYQLVSYFAAQNLDVPRKEQYNMVGYNISQLLFNGGFVFDTKNRIFSIHT